MTDPKPLPTPTSEELAANTAGKMALESLDPTKVISANGKPPGKPSAARPQIDSMRETVESIAVAFILAFLFRTFVAEAFVIPTGSMATTLMGRHKDLECPNCKYQFQAGASQETHKTTGDINPNVRVEGALCPNCGMPVDTRDAVTCPSYKGDRIIVSKLSSDEPKRWDVTVFRYPEEAGTNYIKRLVGLPGEVIKIRNGDLHAQPFGENGQATSGEFRILRKPPDVVLAMLRDVHDNDHTPQWMTDAHWPPRWQPCPTDIASLVAAGWGKRNQAPWPWPATPPAKAGQWTTEDYKSFETDGSAEGDIWVRYQHFLPTKQAWSELIRRADAKVIEAYFIPEGDPKDRQRKRESLRSANAQGLPPLRAEFGLITDDSAYNESIAVSYNKYNEPIVVSESSRDMPVWVGDLAVRCEVAPSQPSGDKIGGEVILELIEAGHRFHCRLNLADRSIRLTADEGALPFDDEAGQPAAERLAKDAIPAGEAFNVMLANVDNQLLVWIDDQLVTFDGPTTYSLTVTQADGTPLDNSPVGIASRGAKVRVGHLRVLRDVYYRSYDETKGDDYPLIKDPGDPSNDQFFMLGDNSRQSQDARSWSRNYVERKLLIGKALYIFWPHSWDSPLPFTPNWERMRFIR
jgi:signal peptidase I